MVGDEEIKHARAIRPDPKTTRSVEQLRRTTTASFSHFRVHHPSFGRRQQRNLTSAKRSSRSISSFLPLTPTVRSINSLEAQRPSTGRDARRSTAYIWREKATQPTVVSAGPFRSGGVQRGRGRCCHCLLWAVAYGLPEPDLALLSALCSPTRWSTTEQSTGQQQWSLSLLSSSLLVGVHRTTQFSFGSLCLDDAKLDLPPARPPPGRWTHRSASMMVAAGEGKQNRTERDDVDGCWILVLRGNQNRSTAF